MAAGSTYTPIATTTLASAQSQVDFTSISASYTDLVLIMNTKGSTTNYPFLQLNGATGTSYSTTTLNGSGSAATSVRQSNTVNPYISSDAANTTSFEFNAVLHFQNYSNTTTFKTVLIRANSASTGTGATVLLYRSTSAIDTITFKLNTGTYSIGSTFTLYGIAAA
jgi:hypothetical protein